MVKIYKADFIKAAKGTGGIITNIANKLCVTRQALHDYIKKNDWCRDIIKHERESIIDVAEYSLFDQVQKKEPWATKYLLSTIGKSRGYTEKQELEHSGLESIKVTIEKPLENMKVKSDSSDDPE